MSKFKVGDNVRFMRPEFDNRHKGKRGVVKTILSPESGNECLVVLLDDGETIQYLSHKFDFAEKEKTDQELADEYRETLTKAREARQELSKRGFSVDGTSTMSTCSIAIHKTVTTKVVL